MVGEAKSYHKNPETSYLEEGFSGIQNAAMVLISSSAGIRLTLISHLFIYE